MRFPSLALVVSEARAACARFPLALISAVLACVAGLLVLEGVGSTPILTRLLLVSALGISLFVSLRMFDERESPSAPRGFLIARYAAGIVALVVLYLLWDSWLDEVAGRRYAQLALGTHLLVAFAPWLGRGTLNGFWQYNRALCLRFLNSLLFSVVLVAGFSVALVALDQLFGVDVRSEDYAWVAMLVGFVFNTWHFLGGVPQSLDALDRETFYPKPLRIFSQYILLPIVVVYLAILTAYSGKVAFTRAWPSGWIGYLVSCVSVLGILSLLFLHPIQVRAEQTWVRTYARGFYVALLPSIGMLCLAIWKRIAQYGVTENRYFLSVIALWLAGIALFFLLRRSQNIRVIPVSLCIVAFVTCAGPWGAYTVSRTSQTTRLQELFERNSILHEGRLQAAEQTVPHEDLREMSAVLMYLLRTHGNDTLIEWFGGESAYAAVDTAWANAEGSRAQRARRGSWQRAESIMTALNLKFMHGVDAGSARFFHFRADGLQRAFRISDYDFILRPVRGVETASSTRYEVEGVVFDVTLNTRDYTMSIDIRGDETSARRLEFEIPELRDEVAARAERWAGPGQRDQEPLRLEWSRDGVRVLLHVINLSGQIEAGGARVNQLQADLYISLLQ